MMYRTEYDQKMLELLGDNAYKINNKDPTNSFMSKNNALVKKMRELNQINDLEKRKLTTYTSVAPKIYGLPKIHKPELKLRPIVSSINSPTYELSKFLVPVLKPLKNPNYNVKNVFDFKHLFDNINVKNSYKFISLDVISLFTKIPTSLAIDLIMQKWDCVKDHTSLEKDLFEDVLKFCLGTSYFSYNDVFYTQDSLAMGNPLSPIVADIVLDNLFDQILPEINSYCQLAIKYVDDTFLVVDETKIQYILDKFNSYHPNLQFTLEEEQNLSLPFLDITVIRNSDGSIVTCHYNKPTHSGRLLNFYSNQPYSYKLNCAKNLIKRTLSLSHIKFHPQLVFEIKKTLEENRYPTKLIEKLLSDYFQNSNNQNVPAANNPDHVQSVYYSFPYLGETSFKIQKVFQEVVPIKFGHRSTSSNRSGFFSNMKDKTKKEIKSGIVYKIDCENCSSSYIGESGQYLKKRMYQHNYDIKRDNNVSALTNHAFENSHKFDFDNVKIVDTENNARKRKVLEAFHINSTPQSINYKTDVNNTLRVSSIPTAFPCNIVSTASLLFLLR
uniref:Reverse transcriptase domain-containing protein n=1 Tax=Cacopsylla melanoneura TaxID=428564 RepID=A0A8D9BPX0_9HEMI